MVVPSKAHQPSSKSLGSVIAPGIFVLGFFLGHLHAQSTNSVEEMSLRVNCASCPGGTATSSSSIAGAELINKNVPSVVSSSNRLYGEGWHSIEVFYGKVDHLERMLPKDLEWFSQARQDEAVTTLFKGKRNGFFVDLAANDATKLSNTYSLEKKFGWTGLCVEPSPMYWANLTYRDCQVVGAIVGNKRMEEVHFRFDAGHHNGITGDGFDNGKHWTKKATPKYTVTLTEVLQRFNAPTQIDYLSLDVEGAEEFIMQNFPIKEYSISLMTVERPKDSLKALLEGHGFKNVQRLSTWGETLWAHTSVMDSLDLSTIDDFRATRRPKPVSQA